VDVFGAVGFVVKALLLVAVELPKNEQKHANRRLGGLLEQVALITDNCDGVVLRDG
jgi:hypothetical protein